MILSSVQQIYRAPSEAEEIEATRPVNEFWSYVFDPLCWMVQGRVLSKGVNWIDLLTWDLKSGGFFDAYKRQVAMLMRVHTISIILGKWQ